MEEIPRLANVNAHMATLGMKEHKNFEWDGKKPFTREKKIP
jgi:hypothetical protein